jgi:hypothetical protein
MPLILRPGQIVLKVRQITAQTAIASGAATSLTWQTPADVDRTGTLTNGANSFTPGVAGWYELTGGFSWAVNGTGYRRGDWQVDAATVNGGTTVALPNASIFTATPMKTLTVQLTAANSVSMLITQNSGGALDTYVSGGGQSFMVIRYLGPS